MCMNKDRAYYIIFNVVNRLVLDLAGSFTFQDFKKKKGEEVCQLISRCVFAIEVCIMENSETQLNQSGQVKTSLMVWLLFFVNMFTK